MGWTPLVRGMAEADPTDTEVMNLTGQGDTPPFNPNQGRGGGEVDGDLLLRMRVVTEIYFD